MDGDPIRVQLKRTKGWRIPPNTVVVSRPSKWGNPYPVSVGFSRGTVVSMFRDYVERLNEIDRFDLSELRGKNLACWCPLDQPCHADVLLELANGS